MKKSMLAIVALFGLASFAAPAFAAAPPVAGAPPASVTAKAPKKAHKTVKRTTSKTVKPQGRRHHVKRKVTAASVKATRAPKK